MTAASGAAADEPAGESEQSVVTPALIREAVESPTRLQAPIADTHAARQLPHAELERGQALELLDAVFGAEVEEPGGLIENLPVQHYLSDHVAIVTSPDASRSAGVIDREEQPPENGGSEPELVESSLPLRTETASGEKVPVDLGLERAAGELEPSAPLVEAEIPGELGRGISVGSSGISIELLNSAQERAPTDVEGEAAFYPNVRAETDLLVEPIPIGVETWAQLRTAESPTTETFRLGLPEGAVLTKTRVGSIEASLNGRGLLSVPPATAIDAAGNEVPVEMKVHGHDVEVSALPAVGTEFPVLVDPVWQVENYDWIWGNSDFSSWYPYSTDPSYRALTYGYPAEENHALDLTSGFPGSASQLSRAEWTAYVPRYFSDMATYGHRPESFISEAGLEAAMFLLEGNSSYYPVEDAGIIDEGKGEWVTVGTHRGTEGEVSGWSGTYPFENWGDSHARIFTFQLVTLEGEAQAKYRTALAGEAYVGFSDHNAPEINRLEPPTGWLNQSESSHLGYTVSDVGLGVQEVETRETTANGGSINSPYREYCTGVPSNPCPERRDSSERSRLSLWPASLPEGRDIITFKVSDPLGAPGIPPNPSNRSSGTESYAHTAEATTIVKIDHSPPSIAVSGTLTEQSTLGTSRPNYTLKYSAADGAEEPPGLQASGATGYYNHPADAAFDSNENRWVADENNNRIVMVNPNSEAVATYSAVGSESLSHPSAIDVDSSNHVWVADSGHNRLVEFNSKGEWMRKVSGLSAPQALAVAPSGNIWVADTGNNRIVEYDPMGTVVGAFGSKGSGWGQLLAPAGIDVAPSGDVWVSDSGNNRLEVFSEDGEFVAAYASLGAGHGQLNHPDGLDVDTRGSVWVVDQGNARVEQFSERGEYLGSFGSAGSGEGQFNFAGPASIASNVAGTLWVTDSGNSRISRWAGPYGTRSGVRSVSVKLDGETVQQSDNACPQGGCPLGGEWTLNALEHSGGPHTVEVTATDGVGLTTTQSLAIHLGEDATPPELQISGTMTEQAELGFSRPRYKLDLTAEDKGFTGPNTSVFSFGSAGTGNGQFAKPAGLALDPSGDLWVVDRNNSRVERFNRSGEYLGSFGGSGSGNGQLKTPDAIAADAAGKLWVADTGNSRIEEFSEAGAYLGQFGSEAGMLLPRAIAVTPAGHILVAESIFNRVREFTKSGELLKTIVTSGSGPGQIGAVGGIAVAPDGTAWISDYSHNRIEQFSAAGEFVRQVGTEGTAPGQFKQPGAISVDPDGDVWVVDQGNSRVQVFDEEGDYVTQFGTAGSGEGQFTLAGPNGIAADAKGRVWVADIENNRVEKWHRYETVAQSGIEKVQLWMDGEQINPAETSCTADECSVSLNWTLQSASYSPGEHKIFARATDRAGNVTKQSLTIALQPDATKPALEVGGELANAPEGWVEQESYGFHAKATDEGGYGATSLAFKIDGNTVASESQECPDGGCEASIAESVDMNSYPGGAHSAEVIATDGAGNTATKRWTINVDPEGNISTSEATATIEAAEATGSGNLVGNSEEEEGMEGTAAGLGLESTPKGFIATGSLAPTEVSSTAAGSMAIEIPGPQEFTSCLASGEQPPEESETEATEPECSPIPGFEPHELIPVSIEPVELAAGASEPSLVEENAVVIANTIPEVDTSVRPLSDGGMIFEDIRADTSPEEFSYRVDLSEEQELVQIDEKTVQVYLGGGFPSFTIAAKPASDAVGTEVPTTLKKTARDIVTLTVYHRAGHAGEAFVYPVVGGSGWEGGFSTVEADMDNVAPEELGGEEEPEVAEAQSITLMSVGPPMLAPPSAAGWSLAPLNLQPFERRFKFTYCWPKKIPGNPSPPGILEGYRGNITPEASECHREDFEGVHWATTVHGHYEYKTHNWVDVNGFTCREWGPEAPKKERCKVLPEGRTNGPADVIGEYRFHEGTGTWQWELKPTCLVWGGKIYPREAPSGGHVPYERPAVWLPVALTYTAEKCDWEHYEHEALR